MPASEVARLERAPQRHRTGTTGSARNRFPGVVKSVEVGGVMALVEIEAGPHLVTAAITRDSVRELGLAPGVRATALVKATSVMVERGAREALVAHLGDRSSCSAGGRGAKGAGRTTGASGSCWPAWRCSSAVALAGCGSSSDDELKVSAASSLQKAFTAYAQGLNDTKVRYSFAGSDELAAQIEQGVRPDVFASANTKLPAALYAKRLVEAPVVFAGNKLVLAVPAGSDIHSLADLRSRARRSRSARRPSRSVPTPKPCSGVCPRPSACGSRRTSATASRTSAASWASSARAPSTRASYTPRT